MNKFHGWIYRLPSDPGYLPTWGFKISSDQKLQPLKTPITVSNLSAQECVERVEAHFDRPIRLHETANMEIGLRVEVL